MSALIRRSSLSVLFAAASMLAAQSPGPAPAPAPEPAPAPPVRVPTFPNSTCPIMGKKVSMPLFVDTELGRIYLCCKPCVRKVLADVPTAHKTAYPAVEEVANERCPVSGEPIGEHRETIVLQGFRFSLCCAGCVPTARSEAQVTLAKLREPALVDVGNLTCPVTDKPVQANAFAVIGDSIVRLASPSVLERVEAAPAAMLAAAKAIATKQPKTPPHRHEPRQPSDGKGAPEQAGEKSGEQAGKGAPEALERPTPGGKGAQ